MKKIWFLSFLFIIPSIVLADSTTPFCPALNMGLRRGVSGNQVKELQKFLAVEQTGYFGPLTEQAVQKWQIKYGIVSGGSQENTGFGVVGPKTRAKISEVCNRTVSTNEGKTETNVPIQRQVEVPAAPATPFIDLKVNGSDGPVTLPYGSTAALSWILSKNNWSWCNKLSAWSGSLPKPAGGSEETSALTYTKTFKITCYLETQSFSDEVTINIAAKPQENPVAPTSIAPAQSYGGVTCELAASPQTIDLNGFAPEVAWNVLSDPKEREFYWHETIDGVEQPHTPSDPQKLPGTRMWLQTQNTNIIKVRLIRTRFAPPTRLLWRLKTLPCLLIHLIAF